MNTPRSGVAVVRFAQFLKDRWKNRRISFLFYLLSLTLLFADYRKYLAAPDKDAVAGVVKRLNFRFLAATAAVVAFLLLLDHSDVVPETVIYPSELVALAAIYSFWRCNEIFIAFVLDATSHLGPGEHATGLGYFERVGLAMRSYLELVLAYAVIYYGLSAFYAQFSESLSVESALYFSGVTIATIGYGDIHPTHWVARLFTVYEVFNGISLIVVSFTVYVSRSVDAAEYETARVNRSKASSTSDGITKSPGQSWRWIDRGATLVIAVATACNVGVALYQWRAMEASVEASRVALESSQRPWVFVTHIQFRYTAPGPMLVVLSVTNVGKGPAFELYTLGISQVRESSLPDSPDYPRPSGAPSRGVLPGGQSFTVTVLTEIASASQRDAVLKGDQHRLYVYGVLRYRDEFDKGHETRFCGFVLRDGFEWCPNHNGGS